MAETKVRGLKINIYPQELKIFNSYQIKNKNKMKEIIEECLNRDEDEEYQIQRSINSMIKEWKGRNRLYRLRIFRKYTKDCGFKAKRSIWNKIGYFLLGI